MKIDFERLRSDLINYFGSAIPFYELAIINLAEVETCNNNRLIEIAISYGFNIYDYEVKEYHL